MEEKTTQGDIGELVSLFSIFLKRGASQNTLIQELYEVGFKPQRIAELVGTTANTVSVALNKMKGKKKK